MTYRVAGAAVLALLGWALYWTARLERADWLFVKGDRASMREATRLAPGNPEYASALAEAEPDRAAAILRDAVEQNPLDGGLRLHLGLTEEQLGDLGNAEASLLKACRLDRGFGPRWALADFYFHRRDEEKFWPAVKQALTASYGDVSEQFRQCWMMSPHAETILERGIPNRPDVLRQYLDFLLGMGRLDAAAPVAGRVLANADRGAAGSLLNYCDRMLEAWRGEEAMAAWKELSRRGWIAEAGRGFDLRIPAVEGIRVDRTAGGAAIRFSGTEPESTEILSQYVALAPNRRYRVAAQYRMEGIMPGAGLSVCLRLGDGRELPAGVAFEAPTGTTAGRLILAYRRASGTTRVEGVLDLDEFTVEEDR